MGEKERVHQRRRWRGVIKGVGSKTEKQKKKVGREGCKKGTKVVSESKRCVVIQIVAKWRWGGRNKGDVIEQCHSLSFNIL